MRKRVFLFIIIMGLTSQLFRPPVVNDGGGMAAAEPVAGYGSTALLTLHDSDKLSVSYRYRPKRVALTSREVHPAPGDAELLARAIYAEARGEPFLGQVAVGAVLVNRLFDNRFPATLPEVIFQPGALCTVRDGQIHRVPNEIAFRAAELALAGFDPSEGSLYFYNPLRARSGWIRKRPVTKQIGRHFFAR